MRISEGTLKLIEEYKLWQKEAELRAEEDVISVDEVVARVASFYEKIRGIVDWRDEHLLRKTAIERILRRRFLVYKIDEDFAENFLSELVRGGHFPNNRISLDKIDEIQAIVEKYAFMTARSQSDWVLSIAAVEIEEALSLPRRERALIDLMTEDLTKQIQVVSRKDKDIVILPDEERRLQIYVAVQRALFKLDSSTTASHILEKFYPDWKTPSQKTLEYVAAHVAELEENIEKILSHPYREKFYQVAERYGTPYLILGDVLNEEGAHFAAMTEDPVALEEAIRHAYNKRHAKLRRRIKRAAFYSVLSVFLTKMTIAFALEIPIEQYFGEGLNYLALGLSIVIPPLLMLGLIVTVQTSSSRNLEKVVMEVMKIIQRHDLRYTHTIFPLKQRSGLIAGAVYGFYLLSFLISFGALVWVLRSLHFSPISGLIFLMFISLILFAGTRIRHGARELMIEPVHEGFLYNIFDIFSLPMIQVGRWLSGKLIRYNFFVLGLNFLIEVPFQMFVEFLEQWRGFLREKKDEIR